MPSPTSRRKRETRASARILWGLEKDIRTLWWGAILKTFSICIQALQFAAV
jgi:hypothetical protein